MSKLSINLVTYNGSKYIPLLFESLKKQTHKEWELLILDNNSQDNTVELIKNELNNFSIQYQLQENKENIGFAGGHNKLYGLSKIDYFLILNQDIFLEPDCLEKIVKFLDENSIKNPIEVMSQIMPVGFSQSQQETLMPLLLVKQEDMRDIPNFAMFVFDFLADSDNFSEAKDKSLTGWSYSYSN